MSLFRKFFYLWTGIEVNFLRVHRTLLTLTLGTGIQTSGQKLTQLTDNLGGTDICKDEAMVPKQVGYRVLKL